jgi:ectoine hydroxylase-related dioxygenase (phytanoyl-CoA dioxygenase family)
VDDLDGVGTVSAVARIRPALPFADATPLLGDAAALRRRADADGYLCLRGLVAREAVEALRRRVLAICEAAGWLAGGDVAAPGARVEAYDDPRMLAFQRDVLGLGEVAALRADPALAAVVAAVCGAPVEPTLGDVPRVAFPGAPDLTTPPHQDANYVRDEPDLWTVWIPLGDCPVERGVLALVPGSHRGGLLPHPPAGVATEGAAVPGDSVWAAGDLAGGDVVTFHGRTVHAACDNVSDRLRLSLDFRYRPARARPAASLVARRGARLYHRRRCEWVPAISESDRLGLERAAEAAALGLLPCPACAPADSPRQGGDHP